MRPRPSMAQPSLSLTSSVFGKAECLTSKTNASCFAEDLCKSDDATLWSGRNGIHGSCGSDWSCGCHGGSRSRRNCLGHRGHGSCGSVSSSCGSHWCEWSNWCDWSSWSCGSYGSHANTPRRSDWSRRSHQHDTGSCRRNGVHGSIDRAHRSPGSWCLRPPVQSTHQHPQIPQPPPVVSGVAVRLQRGRSHSSRRELVV
jgi:hypothetical protein